MRPERLWTGGVVTVAEACVTRYSLDPRFWKACGSPRSCDVG